MPRTLPPPAALHRLSSLRLAAASLKAPQIHWERQQQALDWAQDPRRMNMAAGYFPNGLSHS
jgi:hypothetical protein